MALAEGIYTPPRYVPAPVVPPPQPPPPPAPPAPAPGGAGPSIPGAGIYLEKQALAEKAYQNALGEIAHRKQGLLAQYGFTESGQVDPHSQYGLYQQMGRGHSRQQTSIAHAARNRGFAGQGGLAGRQLADVRHQQGAERLDLQRGYDESLYQLSQARVQAEDTKAQAMLDAQREAALEAIAAGNFTPAAVPEGPGQLPTKSQALSNVVRSVVKKPAPKKKKGRR